MSNAEVPLVVSVSGSTDTAPEGAVPIALYGASAAGVEVTPAPGITGTDLQSVIADLAARIVALEA